MKKFLALFIALIMSTALIIPTSAQVAEELSTVVSTEVSDAIRTELSYYEHTKSWVDMENVDFTKIKISRKINVYECTENGFTQISEAYLLYEDDTVVSLAYHIGNLKFQLMTDLAKKIRETNADTVAIVYDSTGCHLYSDSAFTKLLSSPEIISERSEVDLAVADKISDIKVSNINRKQNLKYAPSSLNTEDAISTRSYYDNFSYCNIAYVSQNPYNNICWAATVAMIVNSVKGKSLTAVEVAKEKYGNTNFDQGMNPSDIPWFMFWNYGVVYTFRDEAPGDGAISTNIKNGYPIYGSFYNGQNSYHAVAIYGINVINGVIVAMDPISGSITCHLNSGTYYYISSVNGTTYTLIRACCKSW